MTRFIALLRAINVGGHRVKMDHLRRIFESLGLAHVETFIASGNVIFETPTADAKVLEQRIAQGLQDALGYEVATFLRTDAELARIAHHKPFSPDALMTAAALNIIFLAEPPAAAAVQKLLALRTDIDDFQVHKCEIYWLCRRNQSESTFSNAVLEKTCGIRSTLRGVNTIIKMATKYGSAS